MQPLEKADDSIPRFVYECLQVIFHLSASSASPAIIYVLPRVYAPFAPVPRLVQPCLLALVHNLLSRTEYTHCIASLHRHRTAQSVRDSATILCGSSFQRVASSPIPSP